MSKMIEVEPLVKELIVHRIIPDMSRYGTITAQNCTSIYGVPVVDAEPVVRCKDCIHHEDCCCVICEEGNLVVCEIFHCHVNKDSFCSNGAKMDGGSDT